MLENSRKTFKELIVAWPLLADDFQLPNDFGADDTQPLIAAALRQPLTEIPELIQDALILSHFPICAQISLSSSKDEKRIICKAPDLMYVKPVNPKKNSPIRRTYTPHREGGVPQIVMEFLSETYEEEYSIELMNRVGKWLFYEQIIEIPRYIIFRIITGELDVYVLESERYKEKHPDENGRFWIPELNLFLGVWEGTHESRTGYWLRWWNSEGELLLWSEERAQQERLRGDREYDRAQRLAEKLRQAGISLDDED